MTSIVIAAFDGIQPAQAPTSCSTWLGSHSNSHGKQKDGLRNDKKPSFMDRGGSETQKRRHRCL